MHCRRRQFLKASVESAGLLALAPRLAFSEDAPVPAITAASATDRVSLGRTGISSSFLAQGTGYNGGRHASDHTRLGQEAFTRLLRHGLDQGMNFLDMADLYGSHSFVREAVRGVPRDQLVMLTKIWPSKADWITPSGGAVAEVDRFRRELGTEMLDVCLIHCMLDDAWADQYARIRDELSMLKEKGVVRAVGVSCHDFAALELAASHPWVDLIFARVNNMGGADYFCDGTPEQVASVLRRARANGKAVVGMKIFGAGRLTQPEQREASLRFVIGNDLVDAVTIGMTAPTQVDSSIRGIDSALAA
jgi:aryl-alcohol dehydrogenase-like predicted oxidoreductase